MDAGSQEVKEFTVHRVEVEQRSRLGPFQAQRRQFLLPLAINVQIPGAETMDSCQYRQTSGTNRTTRQRIPGGNPFTSCETLRREGTRFSTSCALAGCTAQLDVFAPSQRRITL